MCRVRVTTLANVPHAVMLTVSPLVCTVTCTTRGNEALFDAAKQVVLQRYPELSPEALPMHMMEWAQMIERDRAISRAAAQIGK
jgi:hypothetical protein